VGDAVLVRLAGDHTLGGDLRGTFSGDERAVAGSATLRLQF
jgi:hypothetical protein